MKEVNTVNEKPTGVIKRMHAVLLRNDQAIIESNSAIECDLNRILEIMDQKLSASVPQPQDASDALKKSNERQEGETELGQLEIDIIRLTRHEDFVNQNIRPLLREILDRLGRL